jgi:hypothetical protein
VKREMVSLFQTRPKIPNPNSYLFPLLTLSTCQPVN